MAKNDTITRAKRYAAIVAILLALVVVLAIAPNLNEDEQGVIETKDEPAAYIEEEVIASWYDYDLGQTDQRCTPEREPCYSQRADTCASRDYPRGTILKITRHINGLEGWLREKGYSKEDMPLTLSVNCRVNDYGPAIEYRKVDLSSHAWQQLAPLSFGLIDVIIEPVE